MTDYSRTHLKYFVTFVILSSESCLLHFTSCLLGSIAAFMMNNCLSELLYMLLSNFGILNIKVLRSVSQKHINVCDLVLYSADESKLANNLVKLVCSARDSG